MCRGKEIERGWKVRVGREGGGIEEGERRRKTEGKAGAKGRKGREEGKEREWNVRMEEERAHN